MANEYASYVDAKKAEIDAAAAELDKKIQSQGGPKRLEILDELRGLCLLAMMTFHLFYIMGFLFDMPRGAALYESFMPVQPIFAALFILISGFCVRYSKDLSKRGLKLLIYALIISLATIVLLPMFGIHNMAVWFGILHLLACAKLIMAAWNKIFGKVPSVIGLPVSLLLFQYTSTVGQGHFSLLGHFTVEIPQFFYNTNAFLAFGMHTPELSMWDHFPLLPFLFLFLFGVYLGRMVNDFLPKFCYRRMIVPLGWLGKHSLGIYLLHMFVLYGIVHFFVTIAS